MPIRQSLRVVGGLLAALSVFLLASICGVEALHAAEKAALGQKEIWPYRLTAADHPPELDGRLDDPIWSKAVEVDDFHQLEPVDHGTPTQETRAYVAYDDDFLYVGMKMFDSEPELIRATQLIQGNTFFSDDRIVLLLDTFDDDRNSFYFQLNPNGVRRDALSGADYFIEEWEGIWYAESVITADGWSAELAIPFKTLSFDPNHDTWGINFWRGIARTNEAIAWESRDRKFVTSSCGAARGLTGMKQGLGLDVVPSLTAGQRDNGSGNDSSFEPSLDLFYKISPFLTLALTLNTDFSATEVDDRQINLTRFSLFFPEKREFFLQDAGIFNFGRLNGNGIPFFSRRIGLSPAGLPIDLDGGVKLTGRAGRWNIGFLGVRQDPFDEVNSSDLFVGRAVANVLAESAVGIIATSGDPTSNANNSLVGADFLYRNSRFREDRTIEASLWLQQSKSDMVDRGEIAFGGALSYPNDKVSWEIAAREFQAGFNPALGFVNRRGIRQYSGFYNYRHRPTESWIRFADFGAALDRITRIDGELETQILQWNVIGLGNQVGDSASAWISSNEEQLFEPFEISAGVIIPVGRHTFERYGVTAASSGHRPASITATLSGGDFFDGESTSIDLLAEWRPSRHFFTGLRFEINDIDLPGGRFITRLAQVRAHVALNEDWSLLNLAQWDNFSETVALNSRLRWIPVAGREAVLVYNRGWDVASLRGPNGQRTTAQIVGSESALKLSYTLRF